MSDYKSVFDWVQFPEGRARFSGGIRGIDDEQRHETFAVEVNGTEYFGEIQRAYLPNNNDYNIEVLSFGYGSDKYVGLPMLGACEVFIPTEIKIIHALITELVVAGMHFEDKPSLLIEYPSAHFLGQVIFANGWVLARDQERVV